MTDQICATLLEREPGESRDALPACLPPWVENPYRLVSLYEMLQIAADRYLEMGRLIEDWMQGPLTIAAPAQPLNERAYTHFLSALTALKLHSDELGLKVTEQLLTDKARGLRGVALTREIAAGAMGEIYRCFLAEIKSQAFFFIPSHKAKYYADLKVWPDPSEPPNVVRPVPPLFGEHVEASFKSASYDIKEAGNCYAVGRNTGAVFHLMRVLEIGLGVLAGQFKIPCDHTNWETVINRVEKAIADLDKDPNRPSTWRDDREFYSQCASHFRVLKDAWRNHTMHARGKYDEGEAESILRNVRDFIQKLATRLHE